MPRGGMNVPGIPSIGGRGVRVPVIASGNTYTVDAIVQRSGSNLTFTARRSPNIASAETRSYALAGSSTYLPAALGTDFPGNVFPSGTVTFPAGSATAPIAIAAVANAQPE